MKQKKIDPIFVQKHDVTTLLKIWMYNIPGSAKYYPRFSIKKIQKL